MYNEKGHKAVFVTAASLTVRGTRWSRIRTILISPYNDAFMPAVLARDSEQCGADSRT